MNEDWLLQEILRLVLSPGTPPPHLIFHMVARPGPRVELSAEAVTTLATAELFFESVAFSPHVREAWSGFIGG